MQVITAILVFIISGYLNGVNALADLISAPFENEAEVVETLEVANTEKKTSSAKDVVIKGGSIPQILIDNAAYQKAAIIESIDPQDATSTAYEALVNIYCEHKDGRNIKVTTGTGFFIDTDGIIITNAHVAHFLLMDGIIGETSCVIRTGNPAEPKYLADLLYISPSWVRENADMFTNQTPTGTGEKDYALLYVTSGIDGKPMPNHFPALPFDVELMRASAVNSNVYAAGYPADSLIENGARSPLVPKLATTTITELMTFGSNYADVFTIEDSEVGEQGASGGPVLTESGDVVGLISTKGNADDFGYGALRAITMSYVDRTITEETGFDLKKNLAGNIPHKARIFNETLVPFLRLVLQQQL